MRYVSVPENIAKMETRLIFSEKKCKCLILFTTGMTHLFQLGSRFFWHLPIPVGRSLWAPFQFKATLFFRNTPGRS